mmetsp:Transcript_35754/g.55805  ORF Transcript_35754/g.55805 Transcript_35754/m.55805 type:complete len:140 (+) Transcript_35754:36-455(+)
MPSDSTNKSETLPSHAKAFASNNQNLMSGESKKAQQHDLGSQGWTTRGTGHDLDQSQLSPQSKIGRSSHSIGGDGGIYTSASPQPRSLPNRSLSPLKHVAEPMADHLGCHTMTVLNDSDADVEGEQDPETRGRVLQFYV